MLCRDLLFLVRSLLREENLADFQPGLVELRFRVTQRAVQQLGDLVVLVTLYFVEHKNGAAALGKLFDCPVESDAIDRAQKIEIIMTDFALRR